MATDYVDNKQLYEAMKEYNSRRKPYDNKLNELNERLEQSSTKEEQKSIKEEIEQMTNNPPEIGDYIGKCIIEIAKHVRFRPNFIGYTYNDDMESDAIFTCLQAVPKFNPDNTNNPFAYFTRTAIHSFLKRIEAEKKQQLIKGRMLSQLPMDVFTTRDDTLDNPDDFVNTYVEFMRDNESVEDYFEKKRVIRKQKAKEAKAKKEKAKKSNNKLEF